MYYVIVIRPYGDHKKGEELIYPDYVALSQEKRNKILRITKISIDKMTQRTCSLLRSYLKPEESLDTKYLGQLRKMAAKTIKRRKLLIAAPPILH